MAPSSTLALFSFLYKVNGAAESHIVAHTLAAALIFLKECAIISAAGLLPGARQSFCESLGYPLCDK
jgi:hypothetical protein